jgi:hypothetical protein
MKAINGTPVKIKPNTLMVEICCDCGLAHSILYEIKGKHIIRTIYRDDYETKKERKKRRKQKKQKSK